MGTNPMIGVLQEEKTDTQRRRENTMWRQRLRWEGIIYKPTNSLQAVAAAATRSWERGPGQTLPPSEAAEGTGPAHTLILGFWPPDYERIYFCCFEIWQLWKANTPGRTRLLSVHCGSPAGPRELQRGAPLLSSDPPISQ